MRTISDGYLRALILTFLGIGIVLFILSPWYTPLYEYAIIWVICAVLYTVCIQEWFYESWITRIRKKKERKELNDNLKLAAKAQKTFAVVEKKAEKLAEKEIAEMETKVTELKREGEQP